MTKTEPTPARQSLTGEVRAPRNTVRYMLIVEDAMDFCIDLAVKHQKDDPKLAVGAAMAAGRLAQTAQRMVHAEERAEMAREDHDDNHLRMAGRISSPHARLRQARADRRLLAREEREAALQASGEANRW